MPHLMSRDLRELQQRVEEVARRQGLDFFPIIYEVLDWEEINEVAAYGGYPMRYPHWRFGMEYLELSRSYQYGLSKIYEMVINNDPCYAYLLSANHRLDQKLVMAHVCGHADYFKNNYMFAPTNRKMVDEMANHATRVRRYMERYGESDVESFLDTCLSLENLIDPDSVFYQPSWNHPEEDEVQAAQEEWIEEREMLEPHRLKSKGYMESYINPPEVMEAEREKLKAAMKRSQHFPAKPERDVLLFLMEHAPLKGWQRDLLGIVREEAYYFSPQGRTKVANEGWACLEAGSLVFTDQGLIPIEELVVRRTASFVSDGEMPQRVYDSHIIRQERTVRVRTRRGFSLAGSRTHRLLIPDGSWKRLDELKAGDRVRIEGAQGLWPEQEVLLRSETEEEQVWRERAEEQRQAARSWARINLLTQPFDREAQDWGSSPLTSNARTASALLERPGGGREREEEREEGREEEREEGREGREGREGEEREKRKRVGMGGSVGGSKDHSHLPERLDTRLGSMLGSLLGRGEWVVRDRQIEKVSVRYETLPGALAFGRLLRESFNLSISASHDSEVGWVLEINQEHSPLLEFLGTAPMLEMGLSRHRQRIPRGVLRSPKKVVRSFLSSFLDAVATVDMRGIRFQTERRAIAEEVQLLLLNFGIMSSRERRKGGSWRVSIEQDSAESFSKLIGFGDERKEAALRAYLALLPLPADEAGAGGAWEDEIVGIEEGMADVYDISVEETHRYAACGFINHNSYWHSKLLTEHLLDPSEMIDFADHHSGVMATGPGRFNPYKVGIELWRDIEERWNKGRFGREWEECEDYEKKAKWDTGAMLGREKIFEVRKHYNDVTFIDEFLTEDFVRRHGLFTFDFDPRINQYIISSRDFRIVKHKLLAMLTNFGQPVIDVMDANHANRGELVLKHRYEGTPLKMDEARETMENLYKLWKRPVHLETYLNDKPGMLSYDGAEHVTRERSGGSEAGTGQTVLWTL